MSGTAAGLVQRVSTDVAAVFLPAAALAAGPRTLVEHLFSQALVVRVAGLRVPDAALPASCSLASIGIFLAGCLSEDPSLNGHAYVKKIFNGAGYGSEGRRKSLEHCREGRFDLVCEALHPGEGCRAACLRGALGPVMRRAMMEMGAFHAVVLGMKMALRRREVVATWRAVLRATIRSFVVSVAFFTATFASFRMLICAVSAALRARRRQVCARGPGAGVWGVLVRGVPAGASPRALADIFGKFGEVDSMRRIGTEGVWVSYRCEAGATAASRAGRVMVEGHRATITPGGRAERSVARFDNLQWWLTRVGIPPILSLSMLFVGLEPVARQRKISTFLVAGALLCQLKALGIVPRRGLAALVASSLFVAKTRSIAASALNRAAAPTQAAAAAAAVATFALSAKRFSQAEGEDGAKC